MSIGSKIRRAREAAGISIADLADRTKIRASLLEAMERDDFSASGGQVYVRMQLRAIADVLGLDPADLAESGDISDSSEPDTAPIAVTIPVDEPTSRRLPSLAHLGGIDRLLQRRRGANWTAAMIVALIAAVGVLVAIMVMRSAAGDAAPVDPTAGASSGLTSAPTSGIPPSPSGRSDDTVVASGGVAVTVFAVNERSYVSVTGADGATLFEGLVERGAQQTFRDPSVVRLVIGNAGAVTLTVNGTPLGEPGALGEVASLEFGPGTPSTTLR